MKKIAFFLTLLLFVINVFSQAPTNPKQSRDHYLKKSKSQKKTANILLAGGAIFTVAAFLIPKGEVTDDYLFQSHENNGTKVLIGAIGITSMLGSIPFYIASSRNKRKANAATISFNNQKILFPQQNTFVLKTQPALTFKIKF